MENIETQRVLTYIDATIQNIYRELHIRPCGKPSITLRRITKLKARQQEDAGVCWEIESRKATYSFPGKTKDEAWRFGKLISGSLALLR